MSILVKNLYPERLLRISWIIGRGYCIRLTTLFNSLKSLTQWTLPSFLGVIKVEEDHSFAPCGCRDRCLKSFSKVSKWITGTGYGLACLGLAHGSNQYGISCVDRLLEYHQTVWWTHSILVWGQPSAVYLNILVGSQHLWFKPIHILHQEFQLQNRLGHTNP